MVYTSFYDDSNINTPTVDDLDFNADLSTGEIESFGPYGAHAVGYSHNNLNTFGSNVYGTPSFNLFLNAEAEGFAATDSVAYECGSPEAPHTCYDTATGNASSYVYHGISFTLLQPHHVEYSVSEIDGYIAFYAPGEIISRLEPDDGSFAFIDRVLPAGNYYIEGALSLAAYPGIIYGARVSSAYSGYFSYDLTMTPVPLPPTFYLFLSGLLGLIAKSRPRIT